MTGPTWEGVVEKRLVAEDGEVLDRVRVDYARGEHIVESTGKRYTSSAAAQKAAELHRERSQSNG